MAQRVKFTKDYTYRIDGQRQVAYIGGKEYRIPEAHYEAAKAAGVVEDMADAPAKAENKAKA
ncbi:hypothetical protein [Microvirga mediterraneensis]|uniref:Uncharacterized protein n=1 Tax=Microvirga mediterraneensis TaxID=2754695 RepID=A0A838BS80_9HYPH|nr:hypothetical protein [Microvirga mediterraneensis]MBA1157763.1 hypothetical protein [Microvirga mediterraneensis]